MKTLTLATLFALTLTGVTLAEESSEKTLQVEKNTAKLEVRTSQIGFRDTLIFYTFIEQKTVLKLKFGNRDKTFPLDGVIYFFDDSVTEEGIKKWLNNQHSDGLYADAAEPIATHTLPDKTCQVKSHKLVGHTKQMFGEYDNYDVTFEVKDYTDNKTLKLTGFTGKTKVHVKTK